MPNNGLRNGGLAEGDGPGAVSTPRVEEPVPVGRNLADLILAEKLITPEQLGQAMAQQKRTNEKLATALLRLGLVTEAELVLLLARQYRVPVVTIPESGIPAETLRLVPPAVARRYEVIPVSRTLGSVTLAMVDPTNLSAVDDVAFGTGLNVVTGIAPPSAIRRAIERFYPSGPRILADVLSEAEASQVEAGDRRGARGAIDPLELKASADQLPVVRLVNAILHEGIQKGASDIHLDPDENTFHIRFRIDGILQDEMRLTRRLEPAVVSRVKIMANLDIAERRLPQDGRMKFRENRREIDFRVSILPSIFGESVVLRILDREALKLDLTQLGFDPWSLEHFNKSIRSPHGMILITGPTGSGKTTTLYSALQTLNSPDVHILTLEDPVEYNLRRVNQIQVNEDIGLTFASALRSFLRHDPDIILVGEMRDVETAQIAIRAALTGHLVLSTLHTNDCVSTIARLQDMEIPPFLLAASLRLVAAQRLVRKVCNECKEQYSADEESLAPYGHTPTGRTKCTLYKSKGCPACNFTGLKGRIAIYEVMPVTREIRDLILHNATTNEISKVARDQGMKTLREAALFKVLEGTTTVEEVLRVTSE